MPSGSSLMKFRNHVGPRIKPGESAYINAKIVSVHEKLSFRKSIRKIESVLSEDE